jgi:pyrroline-5-carboxylate reductase
MGIFPQGLSPCFPYLGCPASGSEILDRIKDADCCKLNSVKKLMTPGFIGTGEIALAMVTGLSSSAAQYSIRLSPHNLVIATDRANRFPDVSIAPSNQDVLDSCETVVIAGRPPVVRSILSEIRFRPDHHVISVVSVLSLQSCLNWLRPRFASQELCHCHPLPNE